MEVVELGIEDYAGAINLQSSVRSYFTQSSNGNGHGNGGGGGDKTATTPTPTTATAITTTTTELELQAKLSSHITKTGSLRLLRIRNPWGHYEFTGAFSSKSEFWTNKMRALLTDTGNRSDGASPSSGIILTHASSALSTMTMVVVV